MSLPQQSSAEKQAAWQAVLCTTMDTGSGNSAGTVAVPAGFFVKLTCCLAGARNLEHPFS